MKEEEIVEKTEVINEKQTEVPEKKKRSPFTIILNILALLVFLFVIFETVIAFLNFNLIKQNQEPKYFVTTTKEKRENDEHEYTIYNMGLYKIIRKEDAKNYEIKLLPFFLDI